MPVRVLLVDDDPLTRETLAATFRLAGFDVLEAGSGREALDLLPLQPRLIVLDVHLPDTSGFELCRRIKAMPGTGSVAILHLSALHTGCDDRSRGLDGGAEAFLVKPVDPRELLATARALLRIHAAQEAVENAARHWRTTFDAISDAVGLLDPDGRILRCNRALAGLLGRSCADLVDTSFSEALAESLGLAEVPALWPGHDPHQREVREVSLGERWFLASRDPIADGGGRPSSYVAILSDITQRKQMEEQLRQRQKMEAVGRLAGGVAHDFNNLLTAILGSSSLMKKQVRSGEEGELICSVEQAAWRAAELTRQLLGFSQQMLLWLEPCSLNDCVREAVAQLAPELDQRIYVEMRLDPGLGMVRADPTQMGRALTSLCQNARDALREGGRIVLETAACLLDAVQASRHPEARPGSFARLSVSDTGPGIAAELLPSIFDPFFTARSPDKGAGLDLAMAFGIIRQHQGWIECHSSVGRGTRFDVYVPLLAAPAPPLPAPAAAAAGGETILVADDNEMLRKLAATMLRSHGYRVLLASDGREAVEVFQKEAGTIGLVLLDVMMPRLTGPEAVHELRRIAPDVLIVLASGYADVERGDVERSQIQGFIAKPYRERDLIQAVRTALSAAQLSPAAS